MPQRAKDLSTEAKEAMERTGRFTPPYRLAQIMKTAAKITDQLANIPGITTSYDECLLALEIVRIGIAKARGENHDNL